jgi:hypothetical protein
VLAELADLKALEVVLIEVEVSQDAKQNARNG